MSETKTLKSSDTFQRIARTIGAGHCVLFLGAGVSIDSGGPSGRVVSQELSKEFFPSEPVNESLVDLAEAVDASYGRKDLNDWLVNRFRGLSPAGALLSIPYYKWKSIYTVNFDTLLEEAYANMPNRIQSLRPFYSDKDSLSHLREGEIPLYKLHGCLSRANSAEGRLVLNPDDFEKVGESRQRFLNRLLEDMSDYTIFYVGFARNDPDFRQVLLDVQRAAGSLTEVRRSYALQPGYLPSNATVWDQKKVTLIDAKAGDFFVELGHFLQPPDRDRTDDHDTSRKTSVATLGTSEAIPESALQDIQRDFEIIDDRIKAQQPNTQAFFWGGQPNWGLVFEHIDARRDIEDQVLTSMLRDRHLDKPEPQCVLIHAEAGSGKTTLLRRLGVDLALTWDQIVVSVLPYGNLNFLSLERLASLTERRIYVLLDDATGNAKELSEFLNNARRAKARITVIATARTNEWREIQPDFDLDGVEEFEIGSLSRTEIDSIINTLTVHDALGYLAGASPEGKVAAFEQRANKQLLVALREATEGKDFDAIIEDEFDRIPSQKGQEAYLLVASLHRFGIVTRAGLFHRALDISIQEIGREVLDPTTKVIIPEHNLSTSDVYYTTRHPLIADIVFDRKVISDRRRLEFYEKLVSNLDLGYSSDLDAFRKLTRGKNKQLLRDFNDLGDRRALMRGLLRRDPTDASAHQHAAMMELENGNLDVAAKHIDSAISLAPHEHSIRDTEARLVLAFATKESNPFLADDSFGKAENLFKRNISSRPNEPFGYKGLAETYVAWSSSKSSDHEKLKYIGLAYENLVAGMGRCVSVAMLMQLQAEIEQRVYNNSDKARKIFSDLLAQKPEDMASRVLAAKLEENQGDTLNALQILMAGIDYDSNNPSLHFRIAKLMAENEAGSDTAIRGHFQASLLGSKRDVMPQIAYGAYLFSVSDFTRSAEIFQRLADVPASRQRLHQRTKFSFPKLRRRHQGRVQRIGYNAGFVDYDRGSLDVFFVPALLDRDLRTFIHAGMVVSYSIEFNMRGAIATELQEVSRLEPLGRQMALPISSSVDR
jgi:tetratricopeptide (TPR) repeat protein